MVNEQMEPWLRWIPLLPLVTAAIHGVMIGVLRRAAPRWVVIALSCGSVILSFLFSCYAFYALAQLPGESRALVDHLYTWIGSGIGAGDEPPPLQERSLSSSSPSSSSSWRPSWSRSSS